MPTRISLFLALFLLIGCKKDEPAPAPKIATEPQSRQPASIALKKEEPKKEEPKKGPAVKLARLDLRAYGMFALIDAPDGSTASQNGRDIVVMGPGEFGLRIDAEVTELAEEKKICMSIENVKFKSFVVDEPDALVAEVEESGKPHFIVRVNPKGYTCQVRPYSELVAKREDADLIVTVARTMRQTPELKAAQEQRAAAWTRLNRVKDSLRILNEGGLWIRITGSTMGYEEDMKAVAALPETTELELINTDKFTDEHIQMLGSLPRLRMLKLSGKWVNRRVVSNLPEMPRLERLDIDQASIDDVSLRPLTSLTELRQLSLRNTRVGDNGFKILSELKNLAYLDLGNTNLTSAGLVHCKLFKNLKELHINETALTDANVAELAAVPSLTSLNLAMTSVGDKGIEAFAGVDHPITLELYGSDVTLEGIAKLKKANDKISIDTRWLEEPEPKTVMPPVAIDKLPPADPAALVARLGGKISRDEEAADKPIVAIDLTNCKITDADLGHLRAATKLEKLTLAGCAEITDTALPYLASLIALEEVDLRGTKVKGDGLVHLKGMTHLTKLYLPDGASFTARQLAPVASLPNLEILSFQLPKREGILVFRTLSKIAKLKEVNFSNVALTNRHLEFVKNLKNLETLILSRSERLSDRGLTWLKGLEKLKTLTIPAFSGTNDGLANIRGLSNLKVLELYGTNITDAGMPAVGALHNLERLRLDRLNIGDDGVRSLRSFGEQFIEISVGETRITDKGLDAIADNKKIESIDLSHTKVTDAGLAKLQDLEELRSLRLDGTTITGKGFEALARTPRLYRVSLQDAKVDDAGASTLARVSRLRIINLNGNLITNAALSSFKELRQLEELDLDRCTKLTDEAAAILKTYPALKRVSLKGATLSAKAIEDLRQSGVKVDYVSK